jgi:hypothetical protein
MTTDMTTELETRPEEIDQKLIEARRLMAWERDRAQIEDFFNEPGKYIRAFWQEYKPIIYVLGAIFAALVALKVVLGLVGFVTGLPLIGGLLELVGIGYSVWFTNRYLLKAETRQELFQKVDELKQDVIGAANSTKEKMLDSIDTEAVE